MGDRFDLIFALSKNSQVISMFGGAQNHIAYFACYGCCKYHNGTGIKRHIRNMIVYLSRCPTGINLETTF